MNRYSFKTSFESREGRAVKERERKIISDYVCAAEKPKAKGMTKHLDNTLFPVLLPLSGIFSLLWRDIRLDTLRQPLLF